MTILAASLPGSGHVFAHPASSVAQAPDTVALGEVKVNGAAVARPRISSDASVSFAADALGAVPRAFGEADPLRFLYRLPGVTSTSDYSSGASVDGMGYSQNLYRLNGIPVHFPFHFGGIFSVFSPSLYRSARLYKSIKPAGESGVLGGVVAISSLSEPADTLSGEVNAGMIASSASVSVPVSPRFSLGASGRVSYVDALYAPLLRSGDTQASYNLADCDLTGCLRLSEQDMLRATFHYNADNVEYTDLSYSLTTALKWHNLVAGAEWSRSTDTFEAVNRLYYTRFHNILRLNMEQISLRAPTGIDEGGACGDFSFLSLPRGWHLDAGYSVRLYSIVPQWVTLDGIGQQTVPTHRRSRSLEGAASGALTRDLPHRWRLTAALAMNLFSSVDGYFRVHPDPRLSLTRMWSCGSLTLHAGRYHQYLHQVGFSEIGMSSNFKIASSAGIPPQESFTFAIAGAVRPYRFLSLNCDLYYKTVRNQPEYLGAVLDILNAGYRAEDYILSTRGHNAGGSLSARFDAGDVTAMASYSYCLTRRRMAGEPGTFSASNELRHSATAWAAWQISPRWSVSATFTLASGRPYTPVTAIYFIGEKLMMEYGPRNSARLPMYHRLDLGATYRFSTGGRFPLRHEVNLSVINAYGRANVEMSTFTVNTLTGMYSRRDISSLYRFLPSLSYTIKF